MSNRTARGIASGIAQTSRPCSQFNAWFTA